MDASVIKGFLVSIGFKIDKSGLASMQDAVAKAGKVAGNVSGLFDNLGKSFRAAATAAKQVGQAAAGVRPSITALSETGKRLAAALKSIGESARFAAAALRSLVRIVTSVVAVFAAAAVGVGLFALKASEAFDKLYHASRRTGASVVNIKAFQYAVSQLGGSAEDAEASFEGFAERLRSSPGYFAMLEKMGVKTRDEFGRVRDSMEMYLDLGDRLKSMDYHEAKSYASALGMDEATLMAMREGVRGLTEDYKAKAKATGTDFEKAAKDGKDIQQRWREAKAAAELSTGSFAASAMSGVMGAINLLERLKKALDFSGLIAGAERMAKAIAAVGAAITTHIIDKFAAAKRAAQEFWAGLSGKPSPAQKDAKPAAAQPKRPAQKAEKDVGVIPPPAAGQPKQSAQKAEKDVGVIPPPAAGQPKQSAQKAEKDVGVIPPPAAGQPQPVPPLPVIKPEDSPWLWGKNARNFAKSAVEKAKNIAKKVTKTVTGKAENSDEAKRQKWVSEQYPHAVKAAKELGTSPIALIAQKANETGWGQHTTKGADYNMGNIKAGASWSGGAGDEPSSNLDSIKKNQNWRGAWSEPVYDKAEKKWARYRKYESQSAFWDDYVRLIKTNKRYEGAVGQQDPRHFIRGLAKGGYAQSKTYEDDIAALFAGARKRMDVAEKTRIAPPPPAAPAAQSPSAAQQGAAKVSAAGVPPITVSQTTNISVSGATDANATATAIALQQDRVNDGVARNLRGVMIG